MRARLVFLNRSTRRHAASDDTFPSRHARFSADWRIAKTRLADARRRRRPSASSAATGDRVQARDGALERPASHVAQLLRSQLGKLDISQLRKNQRLAR